MSQQTVTRRKIRRAIGPQAVDALFDLELRVLALEAKVLRPRWWVRLWRAVRRTR